LILAGFIEVYLIDAVTGNVVFNCNHKRAKGPVHVIHSENWVVVSARSTYCVTAFSVKYRCKRLLLWCIT